MKLFIVKGWDHSLAELNGQVVPPIGARMLVKNAPYTVTGFLYSVDQTQSMGDLVTEMSVYIYVEPFKG